MFRARRVVLPVLDLNRLTADPLQLVLELLAQQLEVLIELGKLLNLVRHLRCHGMCELTKLRELT